jgi:hypothetical protein
MAGREVALACHALALPTFSLPVLEGSDAVGRNINALAASFVLGLLEQNPGVVGNIMSTAAKLRNFDWNTPVELPAPRDEHWRRWRAAHAGEQSVQEELAEVEVQAARVMTSAVCGPPSPLRWAAECGQMLCPLCFAPFAAEETDGWGEEGSAPFCQSCRGQVFGELPGSSPLAVAIEEGSTLGLLPGVVHQRLQVLRTVTGAAATQTSVAGGGDRHVVPPDELREHISEFLLNHDA